MSLKPLKPLKVVDRRPWYRVRAAYCLEGGDWRPLRVELSKEQQRALHAARDPETGLTWHERADVDRAARERDRVNRENPIPCTFTEEIPPVPIVGIVRV